MKRFLMSSIAAGMALSLIGGPMAMAQEKPEQHGGPAGLAQNHSPGTHGSIQHSTMGHAMPPGNAPHESANRVPSSQAGNHIAHAQNHAPPMQHAVMQGGGRQWHSGDRFDGSRHYVSNWSHYHLRQPPSGYRWVQDGSEFVLVAVASGIISDVILNSAYQ